MKKAKKYTGRADSVLVGSSDLTVQANRLAAFDPNQNAGYTREEWFGPLRPIQPAAPQTKGRQFDYMPGYNLQVRPRADEGITFEQLRNLSENYDILRLIIETSKDLLCNLEWDIVAREKGGGGTRKINNIKAFLEYPDQIHDWQAWLRMILEDMFVLDAATVYTRMTLGGELFALEPIDGATIQPILDETGRIAMPPDPSYRQILKGMSTSEYSMQELLYMPRNPRTHKVFGYSPIEQMITTVNMAIRRQLYQVQIFTEGTIPDLMMTAPEGWTGSQIAQFQEYWDSLLQGNTAARRKGLFVPSGVTPINTKEAALKSEDDEWLARICCYCMGVEATPFVKQMNRATSETVREQAVAEGLQPRKNWIRSVMRRILSGPFQAPELDFVWQTTESVSPLENAKIIEICVKNQLITDDEGREELGRPPFTPEQRAAMKEKTEAMQPKLMQPDDEEGGEGKPGALDDKKKPGQLKDEKGQETEKKKLADDTRKVDVPDLEEIVAGERIIEEVMVGILGIMQKDMIERLEVYAGIIEHELPAEAAAAASAAPGEVSGTSGKASLTPKQSEAVDAAAGPKAVILGDKEAAEAFKKLEPVIESTAKEAAIKALDELGIAPTQAQFLEIDLAAADFSRKRVAEMIGRKWVDGKLITNPNPVWAITETTRSMARAQVIKGMKEGLSVDDLVKMLQESSTFSDARARMIARTEFSIASHEGITDGWKASGVVKGKISVLANGPFEHGVDDIGNAQAGEVPLDQPFPSGHNAPPYHPNCLCTIQPVIREEGE